MSQGTLIWGMNRSNKQLTIANEPRLLMLAAVSRPLMPPGSSKPCCRSNRNRLKQTMHKVLMESIMGISQWSSPIPPAPSTTDKSGILNPAGISSGFSGVPPKNAGRN
jgi:hypothetical protein